MRILLAGSHGLIGSALAEKLHDGADSVMRLVRGTPGRGEVRWDPGAGYVDLPSLKGIDAAVNLAGETIGVGRWTPEKKRRIRESRVRSAALLAQSLAALDSRPRTFLCASAIGIYGDRGDEVLNEESGPGHGFLADVCREWEEACQPARNAGIRVVNLRFGVVLAAHGGALKQMLTPFRLGLGAVLGSGRQYVSWITLDDAVSAICYLLASESIAGPVNVTSPKPVTNRAFTSALARSLHRPSLARIPAFLLRALFGEMADAALLSSARATPRLLEESGFRFLHPDVGPALDRSLAR